MASRLSQLRGSKLRALVNAGFEWPAQREKYTDVEFSRQYQGVPVPLDVDYGEEEKRLLVEAAQQRKPGKGDRTFWNRIMERYPVKRADLAGCPDREVPPKPEPPRRSPGVDWGWDDES